jgi:hypothetical protein
MATSENIQIYAGAANVWFCTFVSKAYKPQLQAVDTRSSAPAASQIRNRYLRWVTPMIN